MIDAFRKSVLIAAMAIAAALVVAAHGVQTRGQPGTGAAAYNLRTFAHG